MTDRLAALRAGACPRRAGRRRRCSASTMLAHGNALVIDKWFALQARASEARTRRRCQVLARAKALLKHPDFSCATRTARAA
jgi:aminopeptidase N